MKVKVGQGSCGIATGAKKVADSIDAMIKRDKKASESAEIAKLKAEVRELRQENEFLKKAAAFFAKERPCGAVASCKYLYAERQ